jgi:hypothetical protein
MCTKSLAKSSRIVLQRDTMSTDSFAPSSVRWPADLKAALERLASAEDRTFSSYVIHVLRKHVDGTPEPKRKARK